MTSLPLLATNPGDAAIHHTDPAAVAYRTHRCSGWPTAGRWVGGTFSDTAFKRLQKTDSDGANVMCFSNYSRRSTMIDSCRRGRSATMMKLNVDDVEPRSRRMAISSSARDWNANLLNLLIAIMTFNRRFTETSTVPIFRKITMLHST